MHMKPAETLMQKAIELAKENVVSGKGGPFAAILVKDHEIIASGCNVVSSTNDPTAHAEIVCIRNASHKLGTFDLSGYELFTTCEPCPMCLGAIYWAHISKVYYGASHQDAAKAGFNDAFIYEELKHKIHDRNIPFQEVLRSQSLEIFKAWENFPHKILY